MDSVTDHEMLLEEQSIFPLEQILWSEHYWSRPTFRLWYHTGCLDLPCCCHHPITGNHTTPLHLRDGLSILNTFTQTGKHYDPSIVTSRENRQLVPNLESPSQIPSGSDHYFSTRTSSDSSLMTQTPSWIIHAIDLTQLLNHSGSYVPA